MALDKGDFSKTKKYAGVTVDPTYWPPPPTPPPGRRRGHHHHHQSRWHHHLAAAHHHHRANKTHTKREGSRTRIHLPPSDPVAAHQNRAGKELQLGTPGRSCLPSRLEELPAVALGKKPQPRRGEEPPPPGEEVEPPCLLMHHRRASLCITAAPRPVVPPYAPLVPRPRRCSPSPVRGERRGRGGEAGGASGPNQ
jgi:hypothetical protein